MVNIMTKSIITLLSNYSLKYNIIALETESETNAHKWHFGKAKVTDRFRAGCKIIIATAS